MNFYYYLFTCAYWVSVKDLRETLAPQEYALLFVSIVDFQLFVVVTGSINMAAGRNLFHGGVVIIICSLIVLMNYLIFLRNKRYVQLVHEFKEVSLPEFRAKRVRTLVLTFSVNGLLAITIAALNNQPFRAWLFQ
jgi:hypothetical protein